MVLGPADTGAPPQIPASSDPLRPWLLIGVMACAVALIVWWLPFVSDVSRVGTEPRELADLDGGNRAFLLTAVTPALLAVGGFGWALSGRPRGLAFGATSLVFVALAFAEPLGLGVEVLRLGRGLGVDVGFALAIPVFVLGIAALGMVIAALTRESGDGDAVASPMVWGAVPGAVLVIVSRVWISSDSHVWSAPASVELANWLEIAVIAALVCFAVVRGGFLGASVALAVGLCSLVERVDFYLRLPSQDDDHGRAFAALGIAGAVLVAVGAALSLAAATERPGRLVPERVAPGGILPPPRWDESRR